jgi:TRAP-type C4-dicarboxylate transport system substrate-binding protein
MLVGIGMSEAATTLKVSHQFAEGDVRDQLVRVFADNISKKLGKDFAFRVYPASSLYKPKEQWEAMRQGSLDLSVFPLDYAAGKLPELSITLLPCSVSSMKQAMAWRDKPIGQRIAKLVEDNGVKILAWAWLDGGIGSSMRQVKLPADAKGLQMRAAGKKFEFMLKEAGASITSMPSSEIYHASTESSNCVSPQRHRSSLSPRSSEVRTSRLIWAHGDSWSYPEDQTPEAAKMRKWLEEQ